MAERKYISHIVLTSPHIWVPVEHNSHLDKLEALTLFIGKYNYTRASIHSAGFIISLGGSAAFNLAIPREHKEKNDHYFILLEDTPILRELIYIHPTESLNKLLISKTRWEMIN